jgi:type IV pilus assembly protein PilP
MQSRSRTWISVIVALFASATARAQAPASPQGDAKAVTAAAVQQVQQGQAPAPADDARQTVPPHEPAPAAPAPPAGHPSPAASPVDGPPASAYNYNAGGRRDPFVSLLAGGTSAPGARRRRLDGLEGAMVGDLSLKGIVTSGDTFIAMLHAPDGKTYLVRRGQRLLDGYVKAIGAEDIVFVQEVSEPLSSVRQRVVRRTLRATEDVK